MKEIKSKATVEKINSILDLVQGTPFRQSRFIVDGFAFHVYFNDRVGFFEVGMFFNPNWPHSNGFSCRTKDEFFHRMEELITDAKKIYVNGGKYPDNYYRKG